MIKDYINKTLEKYKSPYNPYYEETYPYIDLDEFIKFLIAVEQLINKCSHCGSETDENGYCKNQKDNKY